MGTKHIALYLRSANGNQDDLTRQRRILERFIEQKVDFTGRPMRVYCDREGSGLNFGPELSRLTFDLKRGDCDAVLVAKMNRISRSLRDLMQFYDLVRKIGFRFISVNENVDSFQWPVFQGIVRGEG